MSINLAAEVAGSYASYGMVQVLKDIFVEVLELADSTSYLTARYLIVGLLFSLGTSPDPPLALLLFRASWIISCLHLIAQLLDLKRLENFSEKIFLLILTFMTTRIFLRVKPFFVELELYHQLLGGWS